MASLNEVSQWVLTLMNSLNTLSDVLKKGKEVLPETLKERLPMFLGLSPADERIWVKIWMELSDTVNDSQGNSIDTKETLSAFLKNLSDPQRNSLRYILVGVGQENVNGIERYIASNFLEQLAICIKEKGETEAIDWLASGNLLNSNEASKIIAGAAKSALALASKLSLCEINRMLAEDVNDPLEENLKKLKERSLFRKLFWF